MEGSRLTYESRTHSERGEYSIPIFGICNNRAREGSQECFSEGERLNMQANSVAQGSSTYADDGRRQVPLEGMSVAGGGHLTPLHGVFYPHSGAKRGTQGDRTPLRTPGL